MSRTPSPRRLPGTHVVGDPQPSEVYPLKRGGRAVPDRSRTPEIGPACKTTGAQTRSDKRFSSSEENRGGVAVGTYGNNEVQKTAQEFGDARREARGVRTRPVRPAQHA